MMQNSTSATAERNLSNVVKIDEGQIQAHLGEMVRSTVEKTLNAMLDAEADQLCNAQHYQHTEARTDQPLQAGERVTHRKGVLFQKSAVSGPIDQVLGGHEAVSGGKMPVRIAVDVSVYGATG